ncbi:Glycosyl transferase family 2 [Candidatus Magnetomorum sp. HK-1]|nr:Glycosyl transferase family 2 [Candidatus Magnetomorum sp. HK-1]
MSITSIIINYYNSKYLKGLLKDLSGHAEIDKVIIVDNSGELYPELLTSFSKSNTDSFNLTPKIELLAPGKNLGFGAGVNLASRMTDSPFLLVINPDVRLLPMCIEELLLTARTHGSVLTGPRFFWDEYKMFRLPPSQGTSLWLDFALAASSFNPLDRQHLSFYWQIRHQRFWEMQSPFIEIFISGALLLMDRKWAMKGERDIFDEQFFLYYEDNDISLRAMEEGVPPLCAPRAEAVHFYNQAPDDPEMTKFQHMENSRRTFAQKHYGDLTFTLNNKSDDPCHNLDIEDLGLLHVPIFNLDSKYTVSSGEIFFEISVNPIFIPFAQADIINLKQNIPWNHLDRMEVDLEKKYTGDYMLIPENIWKRLADGVYFSRLRDSIKGTLKIWKWEKQ